MNTSSIPAIAPYPRGSLMIALGLPVMAALAAGCFGWMRSEQGCVTTALALSEQLAGRTGRYGTGPTATSLTLAALPG